MLQEITFSYKKRILRVGWEWALGFRCLLRKYRRWQRHQCTRSLHRQIRFRRGFCRDVRQWMLQFGSHDGWSLYLFRLRRLCKVFVLVGIHVLRWICVRSTINKSNGAGWKPRSFWLWTNQIRKLKSLIHIFFYSDFRCTFVSHSKHLPFSNLWVTF